MTSMVWNPTRLPRSVLSKQKVSTGPAETLWGLEALANAMGVTTTRQLLRILRSLSKKSSASLQYSGLASMRCPITSALSVLLKRAKARSKRGRKPWMQSAKKFPSTRCLGSRCASSMGSSRARYAAYFHVLCSLLTFWADLD